MNEVARKINILIVVDKFVFHGATINGPSRYYSWMLENIDKNIFYVTVVSLRGDTGADHLFRKSGHTVIYMNSHKFNFMAFLKVTRIIRRLKIDLLHLSGYAACTLGRIAAGITGTAVIVHEHWADPNLPFYITLIESVLAYKTDHAIAISEVAKQTLVEGKKIPENKVSIIRNGIPLDRFGKTTSAQASEFRTEIGVTDDVMLIGVVGMLEQNKGHKYVIEAMEKVVAQFPQAKLLIIGEGEERPRLTKQIKALGLTKNIQLLGIRDDVAIIDRALNIFIVASFRETASLAALEAMASGCALITTDCGGPTEFIRNDENGLIVPIKDSPAMADAIVKLLGDPELRQRLTRSAKMESEQFDMVNVTKKIEALYKTVCLDKIPDLKVIEGS
ncbi:glycosyltransferase family 4 protein [Ketobacter sp. MCCC 1A13808]|uniref:glycosyltransferase family 4 protein n=1 Tax=Ketobacter sp. MCCC 1A13808 TaxID=2602738 RepID=UPI0012EC8E57|nr:glycosyltransferase family 4 protein [Ketobacter sp. MCCC 1A13808]MVF14075.1 glycosyltransferase family 4 protein [Ketobacter sp. MCCC 1A13808]